jgi:hypothetical protein
MEVGFFTHHLVRHETAECRKWITQSLPDLPPFQTEVVTIWAGPSKERKVTGVLKVFSDQSHVNTLSQKLRETFNDKHQNTFVSKEYFDTLDQSEKKEYIRSQSEYQQKYRTVLISGIRSIDIPTTATQQNERLSLHEWLSSVPDFQQRSLFLNVQQVNDNEVEMQCLTTNLTIAKKWAKNARIHIARILIPIQLSSVFLNYEDLYNESREVEVWNPPPPPVIEFMPNPSQPRKTQKSDNQNSRQNKPQSKTNLVKRKQVSYKAAIETDNNTVTTVNTQESYTQDTISELQNTSQQHQQTIDDLQTKTQQHQQSIAAHEISIEEIDTTLKTHQSNFNSRLATLEEEQQVQQRHHDKLQQYFTLHTQDMNTLSGNLDE